MPWAYLLLPYGTLWWQCFKGLRPQPPQLSVLRIPSAGLATSRKEACPVRWLVKLPAGWEQPICESISDCLGAGPLPRSAHLPFGLVCLPDLYPWLWQCMRCAPRRSPRCDVSTNFQGGGEGQSGGGEEAAVVQPRLCQHPKSRGRCLQVACLPAPEDTSGWRLRLESEAPSS